MRILIVNNLYPPHSRGGAETSVVNEAQSLRDAGHEVSVLTTAPFQGWRSLGASEWKEDGIRVFRFFPLNFFWYRNDYKHNALLRALWYVGNFWGWHPAAVFKRVVKTVKPQAIHLHNINGLSYRYPKICDRLKIPTVFTVHAVHYAVPSGVITRGKKTPRSFGLFAWLLKHQLHSRAAVTAPSQWLLDFYLTRGFFKGQKTVVVVNPLPVQSSSHEPFATNHLPKATCRFLYVGQLESYKGINMMLAALARLPQGMSWQLDIVGDGAMMPQLRKQRDQHVSLRGKLPPDDVTRAYKMATVLLMPSLCEENAPMVIAEANAHGLPVIASAIGGIPEMVQDGVSGMLFEPGNIEELAMHCRRVIEHPEVVNAMRPACAATAKRYASQRIAGEYLKLFKG